jgi:hypothetical protein
VAVNEEISAGLSAGLSRQSLPPLPSPAAPEPETRASRRA